MRAMLEEIQRGQTLHESPRQAQLAPAQAVSQQATGTDVAAGQAQVQTHQQQQGGGGGGSTDNSREASRSSVSPPESKSLQTSAPFYTNTFGTLLLQCIPPPLSNQLSHQLPFILSHSRNSLEFDALLH